MLKRKSTSQGSKITKKKRLNPAMGARKITKGCDTDISANSIDTTMTSAVNIIPLNLIRSGNGSWNRIGRILHMRSIRLKFSVESTFSSGITTTYTRQLRYVLVYDKQPNGTLPTKADIFSNKTQDGVENAKWDSLLAYDNMQRFVILKDETIPMTPPVRSFDSTGSYTNTSSIDYYRDVYLKLNHMVNYKAENSPAVIGDISTGGLYLVYMVDPGTSVVNTSGVARLRYTDQ
jgi:hypothetical protein